MTDSDTILAGDYIVVDVCGGYISPNDYNDYSISTPLGTTYTVLITAYSYDGKEVYVHAFPDDEGIVDLSFGEWNGNMLPLYVTAIGTGSTFINLELYEYGTDDYLASDYLYISVS